MAHQLVYLTGFNASGKTTMAQSVASAHKAWHCVDGDEFVENDPQLLEAIKGASAVINLMRGTFGNGNIIEEVKKHDAEVRTAWEPFFRALFEKVKQIDERKIVLVYHCWRLWIVDLLREYFPTSKIVEVQVTRSVLLDRFVEREVKNGMNHEALWREDQGERFAMLREMYGPEYKGNEDNYKAFVEWRFYYYREPIPEGENSFVVNNDNLDGAQQLEKILETIVGEAQD
mmetsp:Transcript_39070/g.107655  ORF Transcript_39070/g.107655 Transcript_39070/m.107655 type:complete len:230 (+) Transcript_39070:80-769(+)